VIITRVHIIKSKTYLSSINTKVHHLLRTFSY